MREIKFLNWENIKVFVFYYDFFIFEVKYEYNSSKYVELLF